MKTIFTSAKHRPQYNIINYLWKNTLSTFLFLFYFPFTPSFFFFFLRFLHSSLAPILLTFIFSLSCFFSSTNIFRFIPFSSHLSQIAMALTRHGSSQLWGPRVYRFASTFSLCVYYWNSLKSDSACTVLLNWLSQKTSKCKFNDSRSKSSTFIL